MNFTINNNKIENNCFNGGRCCLNCEYNKNAKDGTYKACSESCMRDERIFNKYFCKDCKHNKEK